MEIKKIRLTFDIEAGIDKEEDYNSLIEVLQRNLSKVADAIRESKDSVPPTKILNITVNSQGIVAREDLYETQNP